MECVKMFKKIIKPTWLVEKKDVGKGKNFSMKRLKEFSKKNRMIVIVRNECVITDGVRCPIS